MIKNIGSQGYEIVSHLKSLSNLNTLFSGGIYFGKPITEPTSGKYLYFQLENNSPQIQSDDTGVHTKKALFNFVLVGNDKDMPDVELYEDLDILSNTIRTFGKGSLDLNGFIILNIEEESQSGVLRNEKQNPFVIGQYTFTYQYLY